MNNELNENYNYIKLLEKKRKLMLNLLLLRILIIVAPVPIFVVNLILFIVRLVSKGNFNIYNLSFFTIAPIIATIIILIINKCVSKMKTSWRINFKQTLVYNRFSEIFTDTNYIYNQGISREIICSSGLVQEGSKYSTEDLLCGTYKGVKFQRCDVEIKQTNPSKRGLALTSKNRIYFSGQWMIFDFNKEIDAYVRILEKKSFDKKGIHSYIPHLLLLDAINDSGPRKSNNSNSRKILFEDMEFNKKFETTTTNEHTAFYIVTPHFMESITFLEESLPGRLMLAFSNNKLHVGLHTKKNHFESKIFKKINQKLIEAIDNEALIICKFIDILQLDNNYFKPNNN